MQSRFSEQEGTPSVFQETRREQRTPQVDTHPADQRYEKFVITWFIVFDVINTKKICCMFFFSFVFTSICIYCFFSRDVLIVDVR